jgi:hypothetical protein
MATLKANPKLIWVKRGEKNGTTLISYEKTRSDTLWHRVGSVHDWEPVDFSFLSGPQEEAAKRKGSFTSKEVWPGLIYHVRIMRGGADPNRTLPEGVEAAVDVRSLLEQPLNQNFITDQNGPEVGGTFVWHKIVTKPPTLKQLMVGKSAPQKQANGMKVFSEAVASTPVSDDLTYSEELEVPGLLPGNPHFAIVLVTDVEGNWQILDYSFTTLQREVTVSFNQLQVMNDGDPMGDATANFQWKIFEANNNNRPVSELREIRSFSFDMDVRSTNLYNLTDVHVQGPERVFSDNRFMFVKRERRRGGWLSRNE